LSEDFRGRGRPWEYFLVSTKLETFCYSTVQSAPCRRFDTIPACVRRTNGRTDGQRDGIAVASTALAKRRAVKTIEQGPKHGRECFVKSLASAVSMRIVRRTAKHRSERYASVRTLEGNDLII